MNKKIIIFRKKLIKKIYLFNKLKIIIKLNKLIIKK